MKTLTGLEAKKYILDPVHGPIPITQIEYEIISTPLFQRLRHITQLSQAQLVYPGANHNRFQHSLGTMFVMDKLLNTLKERDKLPNKRKDYELIINKMRLSALLHDCGHLPFSHTFENKTENRDHEIFAKNIIEKSEIKSIIQKNSIDANTISGNITGEINLKDEHFNELTELLPLLSSNADCDRMDYLLRDSYFTGVPYGKYDLDRITNFLTLENRKICFLEKAQDALEDFLFSRYQMYKIVYIHKTVIGYELLLHKIYENFIKKYETRIDLPFFLPNINEFMNADFEWYNNKLYNLTERDFFTSINLLLKSTKFIRKEEKDNLKKLYNRFIYRKPIKNCFMFDNLTIVSKTEYCDKESLVFEDLSKNHPNIINHWSFLRYDPSEPIRIADPMLKEGQEDYQDPKFVRIYNEKEKQIKLLQERTNSYINSLASHHRVLICYYHENKEAQDIITELARKVIF